ncbi:MAG: TetR/AcrR family transcriptional regulator [Melioribacteraceae bacterium]|nr:TetR/AcrR family transcriptional regulator [Melioribacteraceae bacterium]MCF8412823.1 TetR/AcrR family transcriptional regulator [Melioribacteraceae bacterium]MCF8431157.1 TetR/AcrR family transcriptional regulator [Melioribacteraceae bacterium]
MGTVERREREKLIRRNEIIDAAETIFFTKGFESATMDDVATESELSKGTLYLYFKSKDELYQAIVQRGAVILHDLFEKATENVENGLCGVRAIGEAFVQFYNQFPNYHDAMMFDQSREAEINPQSKTDIATFEIKKQTNDLFIATIQRGIDDGSIRKDINPLMTSLLLWAEAMGVMQLVKYKGNVINKFYDLPKETLIEHFFNSTYEYLKA